MTVVKMTKQCIYCHRVYTYNPSVGDFGLVCKYCGRQWLPRTVLKDYPDNEIGNHEKHKKGSEIFEKLPFPRKRRY